MTGSAARTRGNGALPALPGCISTLIDLAGYTADTGALLSCRGLLWGRLRRTALLRGILLGSALLLAADTLAKTAASTELPVSIFTSLLGVPFLLYLILQPGRDAS